MGADSGRGAASGVASDIPAHWLEPDWPAPPGVQAVCTTRGLGPRDGVSEGPFAHFNLGDHVGDAPQAVAANRAELQRRLGARPVFMQQVHGLQVLDLQVGTPDGAVADAAVTAVRGLACTVMVADCLPVLLADVRGQCVAAAHAGWRGLAAGVLERTVMALRRHTHAPLVAWLGPCIGPQVFQVGAEVRAAFVAHDVRAGVCFVPDQQEGRFLADLPALARQRLAALGLRGVHGNDGSAPWCTFTQATHYHSYRRDQQRLGGSGRMAACIWRTNPDA